MFLEVLDNNDNDSTMRADDRVKDVQETDVKQKQTALLDVLTELIPRKGLGAVRTDVGFLHAALV